MGVTAAILTGAAVAATGMQMSAQEKAEDAANAAASEQTRIRQEQKAAQTAEAAAERRRQIREARIARARVLQTAANTGTAGSAGEAGALGSIGTQFASNIGENLGAQMRGENISLFSQNAANFMQTAGQHQADSVFWGQVAGLSMQAASAGAGFGGSGPGYSGTQDAAPISDLSR